MNKYIQDGLHKSILRESTVRSRLTQNILTTTEDKIRICLDKHIKRIENKNSWITPLGLSVTIFITLLSTDFKDFILPSNTWEAIFVIVLVYCLYLTVKSGVNSFKIKTGVDVIIEDIYSEAVYDSRNKEEK